MSLNASRPRLGLADARATLFRFRAEAGRGPQARAWETGPGACLACHCLSPQPSGDSEWCDGLHRTETRRNPALVAPGLGLRFGSLAHTHLRIRSTLPAAHTQQSKSLLMCIPSLRHAHGCAVTRRNGWVHRPCHGSGCMNPTAHRIARRQPCLGPRRRRFEQLRHGRERAESGCGAVAAQPRAPVA